MARLARDVLLEILRDEGVTHIFGNPGSTEMPLLDALVDAPDLTYVLGLQEATALGMADGWALAARRPGFVNLHAAGGLGNAMGVLVASKASGTPLVITAGQQDTRHLMSDPWLSGDLVSIAAPLTKWATEIHRPEDVGPALRRAFALAMTPPTGPVFLSLPMDVLEMPVEGPVPPKSAEPHFGASPDAAALAERLAAHDPERVAILMGDDLPADAADGLVALAETGGFRVFGTQVGSRTAFPGSNPWWDGVLKADFAVIRERLKDCEAVLVAGGRAFIAYPYRDVHPLPEGAKLYHVTQTASASGREFPADMALVGDIGLTLGAVAEALAPRVDAAALAVRAEQRAKARAEHRAKLAAQIEAAADEQPLTPDAAVLSVLRAMPEGALISNDSAATFGAVNDLIEASPGRYFFARGGVLGCSMPASVGAAIAHDGPVFSFVGDGGAMYSPQALWSAAHYRQKVVFIVFNNRRYDVLQRVAKDLGCKNAVAGRFVGMNVEDPAIDFQALSRSMGVPSCEAGTPEAIAKAVAEALERDGPSLIEIAIR
ncbi:thiamine pyrophosphate-binding protein [Ruegeria marisrubri]|uniref:Thiamine pyrophosphate-binding protein n=1 Tax=Ruegeria marisrubri TaxID=1685379 RepID=A0A117KHE0_9RHOB|nr:thiamine pyrophosphate-binding protein [Ruegeria marisrubri]KUJ86265.1 thiamine pyrophosphate-binding protein [Ruegeria marisrubri]